MQTEITCAVIDLDNTLVPTYRERRGLFLRQLRRWNAQLTEEVLDANWTGTFREVVEMCAPAATYDLFVEEYAASLRAHPAEPLPGAHSFLGELGAAGVVRFVLTATSRMLAEVELETAGLATAIERIIAAEDVEHPKPDPRVSLDLQRILGSLDIPLVGCIMVGDAVSDLRIAGRLGMRFVGVTTGRTSRDDFVAAGAEVDSIYESLIDVSITVLGNG